MVDTVNTYEEPTEDAQYQQEMLDKANQLEANNQQTDDRPDWLPEKFNSAEDMANAYNELEQKLGGQQKEDNTEDAEDALEEVAESLEQQGIDFDALSQEFYDNGELSDEAYQALEEANIPRHLVDQFIDGQVAVAARIQSEAFNQVGGEEAYNDMIGWASDALPETSIDAFNRAISSGDAETANLAIQGLYAQYRSENGSEPSLVMGETSSVTGGVFESAAQLTAAMRDPRYATDPAYRQEVSRKLQRSNVL